MTNEFQRFISLLSAARRTIPATAHLIPVWRDSLLDRDTPVSAFARLRRGRFAFLLESAPAGGETWARYTYLGTEPRAAWRLRDGIVEDWTPDSDWHATRTPKDPLTDLESILTATAPVHVPELGVFWSGAVGYFGYDIVRYIERLPNAPHRATDIPDALFVFTRSMVIVDNLHGRARIVSGVAVPVDASEAEVRSLFDVAVAEIADLQKRLEDDSKLEPLAIDSSAAPAKGRSSLDRAAFISGVERIREYIRAGDCFQALLSRQIELDADFNTTSLYRALRALNPSPYMFHLALDGVELVGSSPELLVRLDDDRVTLRPIAGTRPRGTTPQHDEELTRELLADPKERAEHVMLVDLGRNDVGRVARYGTVRVTELMNVERYSHVLHIVSQVEGETRDGTTAMDVLRATFPAGTMTGAPKVRSMEIIDELEPVARGPYAGALGYIAAGGRRMELAITIRTCVIADGVASVQAGAGIVADSVAEREWEETENKASAVLTAIGQVRACG